MKLGVYVDVQNVYYTCLQSYKRHFDYNKFWRAVTADCTVVQAHAYAIDRGDEKQRQFQNILRAIGFKVQLKPYIQRRDGSTKGDWDVGIAVDIMEHARDLDRIVLVSGDGDFSILMNRVKKLFQCETQVYGVPALTSDELKETVDKFMLIGQDLLIR
ncbi:NYN domain-containing protein [Pleionea sediminis]|uniref:LabA-like NYN domain-containing protein n=1 Tax=Pleionea sediminis TaxID=2569479 RepID=UPI00319EA8E3